MRPEKSADPRLWEDDKLERIVGVGKGIATSLEACNIKTVKDIKYLVSPQKENLVRQGVKKRRWSPQSRNAPPRYQAVVRLYLWTIANTRILTNQSIRMITKSV